MNIRITHENAADHPRYDEEVAACGDRHGLSIRQWGEADENGMNGVWFCESCGHRVTVQVQGPLAGGNPLW